MSEPCPQGCGCRLGTEDADRRECACAGPCTMECAENGYPDAPEYRSLRREGELTRVYAPWGRLAHLLAPLESPSGGDLLCRRQLSPQREWLGTGSQAEYERALELPLCPRCQRQLAVSR